MKLNLTALEARILGSLAEKELTTPEYYPLTLNALVAACNQKSNRDPMMNITAEDVTRGLTGLQYDKQLTGTYSGAGSRVVKYNHRLTETLGLESAELALLCELLLRGPQTAGELRGRAGRMHPFASPAEVKAALDALAARQPDPYVVQLPRLPGNKENRYAHALGDLPAETAVAGGGAGAGLPAWPETPAAPGVVERLNQLEARVAALEEQTARWMSAPRDSRPGEHETDNGTPGAVEPVPEDSP